MDAGYLLWTQGGVPTLDGGYLPWTQGVLTLDRGYLPWTQGEYLHWMGVSTLDKEAPWGAPHPEMQLPPCWAGWGYPPPPPPGKAE